MQTPGRRPTWAEVDLSAIKLNMSLMAGLVGRQTVVIPVIKANAYGHGLAAVARSVIDNGAGLLAVATTDEALTLRQEGIAADILVMGALLPDDAPFCLEQDIIPTLSSLDFARALSKHASRTNREMRCHLKIDTGMGRIGFHYNEAAAVARKLALMDNLLIAGIFSHMATPDDPDEGFARQQIERFGQAVRAIQEAVPAVFANRPAPLLHMAGSAAAMRFTKARLAAVRPGIALYGQRPYKGSEDIIALHPSLALKSVIVHIKEASSGTPLGYGCTYVTGQAERIATLPIGYADGLSRRLSNNGYVLVNGSRAPIVGRVCMDQLLINVTGIPNVRVGTETVLIGESCGLEITAGDVAEWTGTIAHEVLCAISARVPRIFKD